MNSSVIMDDDLQTISNFEPTRMAAREITLSQFNAIEISHDSDKLYLNEVPITRVSIIGFVKKCIQISKGVSITITDGTDTITVLHFPQTNNNEEMRTAHFEESSLIKIIGKLSNTNNQRVCIAKHILICKDFNELSLHLSSALVVNKWICKEVTREGNSAFTELEERILKYVKEHKTVLQDELIEHLPSFNKENIEISLKKLLTEKFINLDDEDGIISPGD